MGTRKAFDFEGGTNGVALTNTTAGGTLTINSGSAIATDEFVINGSLGAKFVSGLNALCINRVAPAVTSLTMSWGFPFAILANPPTNPTVLMTLRYAGGVATKAQWTSAGDLQITNSPSTVVQTIASGLTPGRTNKYWLSFGLIVATSTTGFILCELYNVTTGALLGSFTSSAFNLGSTAIANSDFGVVNTNPAAGTTVWTDYPQFEDGISTGIKPSAALTTTAAFTSAGTLTAATKPAIATTAPLSGSGTLTAAGKPALTTTAPTVGTATLSAAVVPATSAQANIFGSATLTATATPAIATPANFTTAGTLTASTASQSASTATLAGSATLTAAISPALTALAAFSGMSTLVVVPAVEAHRVEVTTTLGDRPHGSALSPRQTTSALPERSWGSRLV